MTEFVVGTMKNVRAFRAEENELMAACSIALKESISFDKELTGVSSETVAIFL